jgi:hypothetical protein
MNPEHTSTVREAVAVFKTHDDLEAAIDDLLTHGFDRAELSVLASEEAVKNQLGHAYRSVRDLEDDASVPQVAYVSSEAIGDAEGAVLGGLVYVGALAGMIPVFASGGALLAGLLAATIGGGAGAAVGSVLSTLIDRHHADYIDAQLQHGGLLLWVRTWNEADEQMAIRILSAHSGSDVHLHGLPELHPALEDRYLGAVSEAEREYYQGEQIATVEGGETYAFGKLFATAQEARDYLDRRAYLETLHTGAKSQSFDLHAALLDPTSQFKSPADLIATGLPDHVKIEILKRWAYDAKELELATDEGMPLPNDGDLLQDIQSALVALQTGSK